MFRRKIVLLLSFLFLCVNIDLDWVVADDLRDNSFVFQINRIEDDNSTLESDVSELTQSLFKQDDYQKLQVAKKVEQDVIKTMSGTLFSEKIKTKSKSQADTLFIQGTLKTYEKPSGLSKRDENKGQMWFQIFYGLLVVGAVCVAFWLSYRINGEDEYAESY